MSIWNLIVENQETIVGLTGVVAGWLGVGQWRKKVKESTAADVDRWASTAAGAVLLLVRAGLVTDHQEAIERVLRHYRALASAVGVHVRPEHEHRVMAIANTVLVAVGPELLGHQLETVGRMVQESAARMERLPWPTEARP